MLGSLSCHVFIILVDKVVVNITIFQKIKFLQCQYGPDRGKPSPGEL